MAFFKFFGFSDEVLQEQYQHLLSKFMELENNSHELSFEKLSDHDGIIKNLKSDFIKAFSNDEFKLFYQPQFNIEGKIVGVEAFLRWKHNKIGFIYPPLVIGLSKEVDMLDELGFLIFNRASRDFRTLRRHTDSQFTISINVAVQQLNNPAFAAEIEKICFESDIKTSYFEIDLSENIFQTESNEIRELVKGMRDFGFRIAIKDFGMDESSMRFLTDGLVNTVKLDGKLVKSILVDESSEEAVKRIMRRSESRMYKVVSEQIENVETFEKLKELGCQKFQGYLFTPPMSIFDLVRFLDNEASNVVGLFEMNIKE